MKMDWSQDMERVGKRSVAGGKRGFRVNGSAARQPIEAGNAPFHKPMKFILPYLIVTLTALPLLPGQAEDRASRTKDWLPPAGALVMPVQQSASPDGRYAIGWGYEKGPVDWSRLAHVEEAGSGWGEVTFSTKLADLPDGDPLDNDANFLLDLETGASLCKLGIYYPGERPSFNHDGLIAAWSPGSACVVMIVTQKWESEFAAIAWIREGKCDGSYDILAPLIAAARAAGLKSKHPASRRLADENDYRYSLQEIEVKDDGSFLATIGGEIPKLDEPEAYIEVKLEGVFSPGEAGGSAWLTVSTIEVVLPAE